AQVAAADEVRGEAAFAHAGGLQGDFESDVEGGYGFGRVEVGERGGVACGTCGCRDAPGRQGFEGNDPRGDGGGEALREEGTERLVFPRLDVARGPVVEEAEAKDVAFGFGDGDWLAKSVARTYEETNFELVVERSRGSEDGGGVGGFDLAAGAAD